MTLGHVDRPSQSRFVAVGLVVAAVACDGTFAVAPFRALNILAHAVAFDIHLALVWDCHSLRNRSSRNSVRADF